MKMGYGVLVVTLLVASGGATASDATRPGADGMERLRVATLDKMGAELRQQLQPRLKHDLDLVMLDSRRSEWAGRSGTAPSGASWNRSAP